MQRHCLTLDLKDDPGLIRDYLLHHQNVWSEVIESILASGILSMQIFHVANRLVMIIEASDNFSFEEKSKMDKTNLRVQEWETLMDRYQDRLPFATKGEKWVLMEKIFDLNQ